MNDYKIIADSACDLPRELAAELDLTVVPLTYRLKEKDYQDASEENGIGYAEFYSILRQNETVVTSAMNYEKFIQAAEPLLKSGNDILYIGFSSALSASYNNGALAARDLREKYPGRKIYTVDSLCASLGLGMLLYLAVNEKRKGGSIEEVKDFAEKTKLHICHWFTVDDLGFLKRGGRVSAAAAIVGTMLSIKPVLHVDNEGRLIFVSKTRGRKNSIKELFEAMKRSAVDPAGQTVFISHGDCADDADGLAEMIKNEFGIKNVISGYVGPVIGSHSGPGTLALFFIGKER